MDWETVQKQIKKKSYADGRWIGIMASYFSIGERLDGKSSTRKDPPFSVGLISVLISMIHVFPVLFNDAKRFFLNKWLINHY